MRAEQNKCSFPRYRDAAPAIIDARLVALGVKLRRARDGDIAWMRDLFGSTRADDMRGVPWSALEKRQFLDSQFALQHKHFTTHFADAHFHVVGLHGRPIGRYYLSRDTPMCIIDISIVAAARGRGIGTALIESTLRLAQREVCSVYLHVLGSNLAAKRLYERLGFIVAPSTESATHIRMNWSPALGSS